MSQSAVDDMTLTFADNLRLVRLDRNLSQRELAERSGIAQGHICHFESGRRQPLLHNLLRIARALEVSTDLLLGRNDHVLTSGRIPRMKEPTADGSTPKRRRNRGGPQPS